MCIYTCDVVADIGFTNINTLMVVFGTCHIGSLCTIPTHYLSMCLNT
jgi:hypothetical protein